MTVFKTFLKIVKAYKGTIIMYTAMLVGFGALNMTAGDTNTNFVAEKPDVYIVNNDVNEGITESLINYISDNSNIITLKDNKEALSDALFYRDVNYIIEIPKNYRQDFLDGKNPKIKVKSTGDYQASLAELLLKDYTKLANMYASSYEAESEIIKLTEDTLKNDAEVKVNSKLDTMGLAKADVFYNFANYSLLAGCVYVICLVLSSFKEKNILKRTVISSTKHSTFNRQLLLSNALFVLVLWMFYVVLSIILVGDIMFTTHGLLYMANSFVFSICALTVGFMIANLTTNKGAINGLVNVVALGSSFLCGAFVPAEWLPEGVLKIAHILPSYWYINANDRISNLEKITADSAKPIVINMAVVVGFSIIFVIITNMIAGKKRKIA